MNHRRLLITTGVVAICFLLVLQVAGQLTDVIIVNNADEIRQVDIVESQGLLSSLTGVAKRVLSENANEVEHFPLPSLPAAWVTRLGSVADWVLVEVANETRHEVLSSLPDGLKSRLGAVLDRILIETANANRHEQLNYPIALINDKTAPIFSQIQVKTAASDAVKVTWITNEFANSFIKYGEVSGDYPSSKSNSSFVKEHSIRLSGLVPGTTYYYRLRGTDLSGNTKQSAEKVFTFVEEKILYIPSVRR